MSELTPITREEALLAGQDLTPITRQEMFIKHIYDASQEVPTPITREEMFLKKAADTVHGIEVESLSVTENGIYTAPSGKAYTPVNVNVPLPANAYLLEEITDGDLTSAKSKPLPSVSVAVTDADELDVFVGDSETIVSDNEPYIYRQSKGGRMVSERLVGASVAWNQLDNISSRSNYSETIYKVEISNSETTLTVLETPDVSKYSTGHPYMKVDNLIASHKYLIFLSKNVYSGYGANINVKLNVNGSDTYITINSSYIVTNSTLIILYNDIPTSAQPGWTRTVKGGIFDLTLMFGSTIADYVYSLEQSTAGSGIAWLKSYGFFSEDYYAYDSGSLKSVSVSAKKVRDASDNVIATYPLPSSDLRGLYKLANNKLYCDGDIQYGDGWRLRRYGTVDLGTLTWTYVSADTYFSSAISGKANGLSNILCPRYIVDESSYIANLGDKVMQGGASTNKIYIKDSSYTDAATFKTAMSGVYLIYELATPIWEKTHPFTNPQTVGSTEEFVTNLPVGHESKYYDGDIHHSYIYNGDARAKVTGDVDIVNGTAPNATCSVCVVMPDGDEIWSDAGDVTAEIWT